MIKDQEIDVIICVCIAEDSNVRYLTRTGIDNIPELQPLRDLLWMSPNVDDNDIGYLSEHLSDILLSLNMYVDFSEEFPYEAFKQAKNPKVITIYW